MNFVNLSFGEFLALAGIISAGIVALYERAWFGLREPDAAEAERARSLATRVAG